MQGRSIKLRRACDPSRAVDRRSVHKIKEKGGLPDIRKNRSGA